MLISQTLTKAIFKTISQTTSASVPYQLNLISFNNFHNCIRLIHLLHPPLLLSLDRRYVSFSLRNWQRMHSLSGTATPVCWDWPGQHWSRLSSTSTPHQTRVNFPLTGLSAYFPRAQIALIPLSLLPSFPPPLPLHLPLPLSLSPNIL